MGTSNLTHVKGACLQCAEGNILAQERGSGRKMEKII